MVTIEEAELAKLRSDLAAAQESSRLAGHQVQNLTVQRDEANAARARDAEGHTAALTQARTEATARCDAVIAEEVATWEAHKATVLASLDALRETLTTATGAAAAAAAKKANELRRLDEEIVRANRRKEELSR